MIFLDHSWSYKLMSTSKKTVKFNKKNTKAGSKEPANMV